MGASCVRKRRLSPNLLKNFGFSTPSEYSWSTRDKKLLKLFLLTVNHCLCSGQNSLNRYDTAKKYVFQLDGSNKFLVCSHFKSPRILLCSNCNIPVENISVCI